MANIRKIAEVKALTQKTIGAITSSTAEWKSFLHAAAWTYKYPFHEQLMIYAQKPSATACAPTQTWNKLKRWINKGTKGIALFDTQADNPKIQYVFDVADTNTRTKAQFKLWEMTGEHETAVKEMLADEYDVEQGDMTDMVINAARNALVDALGDALQNNEVDGRTFGLLYPSVTYTVLTRLGVDPEMDADYFSNLELVIPPDNTEETLYNIGNIINETSNDILRNIENEIRKIEKEKLANKINLRYNKDVDNSHINKTQERSNENGGNHLQDRNNTSGSRRDRNGYGGATARTGTSEIANEDIRTLRGNAESVSDGTQEQNQSVFRRTTSDGRANGTSELDRPRSDEADALLNGEDGERGRSDGGTENAERSGVDAEDEQHNEPSGGNSVERTDLRIESENDQTESIDANERENIQSSSFSLSSEPTAEADESQEITFDSEEFENLIPHDMRYKETNLVNGNELHWVTQEYFTTSDLEQFQNAVRDYAVNNGIKKFYVTVRDMSDYDFESDMARKVCAVVTADEIQSENYINAARNDISHFNAESGEFENYAIDEILDANPISVEIDGEWKTFNNAEEAEQAISDAEDKKAERAIDINEALAEKDLLSSEERQALEEEYAKLGESSTVAKEETPKIDYHITNDELGYGGAKEKCTRNIIAIETLKKIESEGRNATEMEQELLAQYVGWGGIPQIFDETNTAWDKERELLKESLTDEEYKAAMESTLNAHYTSPVVIRAIYEAVENMGFKGGNILEPAMGVGNFFGMLPKDMAAESKLYGVELDSITGRIAKQLYQNADITVDGFENTNRKDFYDLAVGNVPFGNYKVFDKEYNKLNFNIHDYFFAKAIDQVRVGGVIAFITSRYTMDKKNPSVRKYIAERADLLGAIRLPNNAFLKNAGTNVTTDILFLQKRDHPIDVEPSWVQTGETADGIPVNSYFVDHPEMVLGELVRDKSMYGDENDVVCNPIPNSDLGEQLKAAVANIHGDINKYADVFVADEEEFTEDTIPADPDVRNFSYTVVDGEVYYRENSIMRKANMNKTATERVKGMIEIRDCLHKLLDYQLQNYEDNAITKQQVELNNLYDAFVKKYGNLNSRGNAMAFGNDAAYPLLLSLEVPVREGETEKIEKADIFYKRTIVPEREITFADTAADALAISLAEKAKVDMEYMTSLTGKSEDEIADELRGIIFKDFGNVGQMPPYERYTWKTADEFLSGNVRQKLADYKKHLGIYQAYNMAGIEEIADAVAALEKVQPKDLGAGEIEVRLGATWIDPKYIKEFINDLLKPTTYYANSLNIHFTPLTGEWHILYNKYGQPVSAKTTYGTDRASAYQLIEDALNLRETVVKDSVWNFEKDKREYVTNNEETMLAQQKQQLIKDEFKNWIWKDPERRETLCKLYNERFNSTRLREYDGSHLRFAGQNPNISLRPHQNNAVARIMYGGNTLLAHVVGAGKTFEMATAAMEMKRIGLCQKSLFVVPNHLTEQWGAEFLRLYPAANILVATKKDFERRNRRKFCGRIATGDYDAIIIGHSQFERIPLSNEENERVIQEQIDELEVAREKARANGDNITVKQLAITIRRLEAKLKDLHDQEYKDDTVTFEELGVDRLFIDEAHYYKNLFFYTKMNNVSGVSSQEVKKTADLYAKCRYLNRVTDNKGVIFATGTPVTNSLSEMYAMQKYLQYDELKSKDLLLFDQWASIFAETTTELEFAPEGTGFRTKTRLAKFINVPELQTMFRQIADVQTKDMLKLPVPEAEYKTVVTERSETQKQLIEELGKRADDIRKKNVPRNEDNMLLVTTDGRKLALDQRLTNELLPDEEHSKVNTCIDNVYRIWEEKADTKATQLIFCDMSTPKGDGSFTLYEDIKEKLIKKGVPENEIAFIHDANTEKRKQDLFESVKAGKVRILLGSTPKMGAGTNVQDLLFALHHLDVPWRPADIEQREGRMIRQGNTNDKVEVYRYVTKDTFDGYLWQTLEKKQQFVSQVLSGAYAGRTCDDIDEVQLDMAEVKAVTVGNPLIKEKMDLDTQVARLRLMKAAFQKQHYKMEDRLLKELPQEIKSRESRIAGLKQDILTAHENRTKDFSIEVLGNVYTERKEAGEAILASLKKVSDVGSLNEVGRFCGLNLYTQFDSQRRQYYIVVKGKSTNDNTTSNDAVGNIRRIENILADLPKRLKENEKILSSLLAEKAECEQNITEEFPQEDELKEKEARLKEVDMLINLDDNGINPQDQTQTENKLVDGNGFYCRNDSNKFCYVCFTEDDAKRLVEAIPATAEQNVIVAADDDKFDEYLAANKNTETPWKRVAIIYDNATADMTQVEYRVDTCYDNGVNSCEWSLNDITAPQPHKDPDRGIDFDR